MKRDKADADQRSLRQPRAPERPAPAWMSLAEPAQLFWIEHAALLAGALLVYARVDVGWGWFALLFFAPDLAAAGYLAGPRLGATAYNLAHTTSVPAALAIVGLVMGAPLAVAIAAVWVAHIAMDRLVGYSLKDPAPPPTVPPQSLKRTSPRVSVSGLHHPPPLIPAQSRTAATIQEG